MKRLLCRIIMLLLCSNAWLMSTVGGLDNAFGTFGIVTTSTGSVPDVGYASVVQPDGKVVIAGTNGTDMILVRYNYDGTTDTTFGTDGVVTGIAGIAYGVALSGNGKIIVVGTTGTSVAIAQYTAAGALDTSNFGSGSGYVSTSIGTLSQAYAVAVQPADGKIVVVGSSNTLGVISTFVARYSSAGGLDTSGFNALGTPGYIITSIGTTSIAYSLVLQPTDGKIVVTGTSDSDVFVARYTTAGVLDTAGFNTAVTPGYIIQSLSGGTDIAYGVGLQSTGKIIIAGQATSNAAVARFTTTGLLDTSFGISLSGMNTANTFGGTAAVINGLVIQSDDKIVVGATVTNTSEDFGIARYLADGSALDTTNFNPSDGYTITDISGAGSADYVGAIALQPNGEFILTGTTGSGNTSFATARYLGNSGVQGCIDTTYQSNLTTGFVKSFGYEVYPTDSTASNLPKVQSVFVASDNTSIVLTTTSTASQLVQLSTSGVPVASATTIAKVGGASVIMDSLGRVLVCGTASGHGWLARYTLAAGVFTLDPTFNGGAIVVETAHSTSCAKIAVQSSGRIIVMGQGTTATTGVILGYTCNGVLDTTFGTNGVYSVATTTTLTDLVVDSLNNIYCAGSVTGGDVTLYGITANGSGAHVGYPIDTTWASASYGSASLTFDNAGNIIIGAITTSSGAFNFKKYVVSAGGAATTTGSFTPVNLSSPVMTAMQADSSNNIYFTGYDANNFFVGKTGSSLALVTSFAPYAQRPGILTTRYNDINPTDTTTPTRVSNALALGNANGQILFGGWNNLE